MENAKNPVTLFIIGFVTIVVGLALLPQIASTTTAATTLPNEIANRSITFANGSTVTLGTNYIVTNSEKVYGGNGPSNRILNAGAGANPNYTIDYVNGRLVLYNSTPQDWYNKTTLNISYVDGSSYVGSSSAREFVRLIQIFYALSVTIAGVWLAIQGFKGIGLM